jgi:hypothetical protein
MTKFEPGKSGNIKGRPQGAKNKVTPVTKQELTDFLNDEWETIKRDFKKLEPADRVKCFIALLEVKEKMRE